MRNGYTHFIYIDKAILPSHEDHCDCVMTVQLFM